MHIIPHNGVRIIFFLLLSFLFIIGCNNTPIEVPPTNSITKSDRQKLGEKLVERIEQNSEDFPILQNIGEDTTAYFFVQTLYNQATAALRLDVDAPMSNRWNFDDIWNIYILDKPTEKDIFVLPGGSLFITTGFLLDMEREFELYYLLAFEAALMNEQYLLNRMIADYNTLNIKALTGQTDDSNGVTIERLLEDVSENYIYEPDEVLEIDYLAVDIICNSSIYRPDGITDILADDSELDNLWFKKRMNYGNRAAEVLSYSERDGNCGTLRSNGAYQDYILDILN